MPASYRILPHLNIYLVQFRGEITVDQNMEVYRAYRADPQYDGGQHLLLDATDCKFPERFFEEVQRIAAKMAPYSESRDPRARTAIYAPGKVAFGICKLYRDAVKDRISYQLGVYRNPDEALRSLGLDTRLAEVRDLLPGGQAGYGAR